LHQLAWVRLMVARHPWIYWLSIIALAGVIGLGVARAVSRVDAERRSWGDQHEVWVASATIDPGEAIVAERRDVPVAVVPDGAVTLAPTGSVARQHIELGEIVTRPDVTAQGSAALVPDDWVAFSVTASGEHLAAGDHLDVFSGDQLIAAGSVVAIGDADVMVAVPATAAPAMAGALLANAVTLALTSTP
jgi:hypothetical protein